MAPVRIRPEAEIRAAAQGAFEQHRRRVAGLLPLAEIEHVGATSIPGALTKGDVDLLVRVERGAFDAAVTALRDGYAVHQPENWTPTYASFVASEAASPPIGIQVAVAGSRDDLMFDAFRAALIADPELLASYNALKLAHDGEPYDRYTNAKGAFIEQLLDGLL